MTIKATCHCGACTIEVDAAPENVNSCQCSICRRYGTLWAYYSPKNVRIDLGGAEPDRYMWGDRDLQFNRCKTCGCVTHWTSVDTSYDRMAVNARMFPREILDALPVRRSEN